jgi:hypothetical protein
MAIGRHDQDEVETYRTEDGGKRPYFEIICFVAVLKVRGLQPHARQKNKKGTSLVVSSPKLDEIS